MPMLHVLRRLPPAVIAAAVIPFAPLPSGAASGLTGPQVVDRCRQAYDALSSYKGRTEVHSVGSMFGKNGYHTLATIQFQRPGKIRVEGTTLFGSTFAYVSDGSNTWEKQPAGASGWSQAQNVEMAIAAATGVSQSAGSLIPAVLLHATFGAPFGPGMQVASAAASDNFNGRAAYRIAVTMPMGSEVCWIDKNSFLLRKVDRHVHISMGGKSNTLDSTFTFVEEQLNPKLPASTFAKPAGAH